MAGKRKRSKAWLYFTKNDSGKATCRVCRITVSRRSGSTSIMLKHLLVEHGIEVLNSQHGKSASYRKGLQTNDVQSPGWEPVEEELVEENPSPRRKSSRLQDRQQQTENPAMDPPQGGFDILERELGALRESMNTRLHRMESGVLPLLTSIEDSLKRLADAAEHFLPTQSPHLGSQPTTKRRRKGNLEDDSLC